MANEQQEDRLSAYTALAALLVAVTALFLTDHGWNLASSASRLFRTAFRPSEGTCASLLFNHLAENGPIHQCQPGWPTQCHHQPTHARGTACWQQTVLVVFNRWTTAKPAFVRKPACLPLSQDFLRVDADIVHAFILLTCENMYFAPNNISPYAKDISVGGVHVTWQVVKMKGLDEQKIMVFHLQGTVKRQLTKTHLRRLLDGGPPLYEDLWNQSITSLDDVRRGGWVAAIGLEPSPWLCETALLPLYIDNVKHDGLRRGVFWRSIYRVIDILDNIWRPAFEGRLPAEEHITSAMTALKYMKNNGTQSGASKWLSFDLVETTSAAKRARIISHFNGEPNIARSDLARFRQEWEDLLINVLTAAFLGTSRCLEYFKNSGREMNIFMPMGMDAYDIYLRGC